MMDLRHPFVANLVTTFRTAEDVFLLFEAVMGGEFFYLIQTWKALTQPVAAFYGAVIVISLSFFHNK